MCLALQAFDKGPWPRMDGRCRGRILFKLADLMEVGLRGLFDHVISDMTSVFKTLHCVFTCRAIETDTHLLWRRIAWRNLLCWSHLTMANLFRPRRAAICLRCTCAQPFHDCNPRPLQVILMTIWFAALMIIEDLQL